MLTLAFMVGVLSRLVGLESEAAEGGELFFEFLQIGVMVGVAAVGIAVGGSASGWSASGSGGKCQSWSESFREMGGRCRPPGLIGERWSWVRRACGLGVRLPAG